MTERKNNLKYHSILPKPPHTSSGYQLFTKAKFNEFPEHIPASMTTLPLYLPLYLPTPQLPPCHSTYLAFYSHPTDLFDLPQSSSFLPPYLSPSILTFSPDEKISKVAEMWKFVSESEKEIFKERADILKKENKKRWDENFHQREEVCLDHQTFSFLPSCSSSFSLSATALPSLLVAA